MKRRYRELDDSIAGVRDGDEEISELTDTAHLLERTLDAEPPYAARERSFFVEAVAARNRRRGFWGAIGPVLAGAAVLGAFGFTARSALPGEQIYPLRKAIAAVGLAESPNEEINERLARARTAVNSAEESVSRSPERATELAIAALVDLNLIERLLADVGIVRRTEVQEELESLEGRAAAVIAASFPDDENEGRVGDDVDDTDDSSGPGSGDDSDNDSSGPGGDDDSSGPGSGDASESDDNSGSGSGGDGEGDNSGPGGGGSDDSGSDDSGSGGGDSGSDGGD